MAAFPGVDNNMPDIDFYTDANVSTSHHGQLLLLEDTCEEVTVDGQPWQCNHKFVAQRQASGYWGNASLLPEWITGTLSREWSAQHQLFMLYFRSGTPGYTLPTSAKLGVAEHTGGIPVFPGENTGGVYNANLTFRNDGTDVANGVGLYKITGHKDSELQVQFPEMETLYDPKPKFKFVTSMGDHGVCFSTFLEFDNRTRTHGPPDHQEWDSPRIFEVGLMVDPVYVLILADSYNFTAGSNRTAIKMVYKYEPFVALNTPFKVSRDNQMQVFKPIALPAVAMIQAFVDSGACCGDVYGEVMVASPCSNFAIEDNYWYIHDYAGWGYTSKQPVSIAWPGSPVAYVVWNGGGMSCNAPVGSVLRINIWSAVPFDWLPWMLLIAAGVGIGVMAVMLRRRK